MFPIWNIGDFQHKLLKPIQSCLLPYKTIRAINLRRFMIHFLAHGSVCSVQTHVAFYAHDTSVFLAHQTSFLSGRFEKMFYPIMSYIWCLRSSNLRSSCTSWFHRASREDRHLGAEPAAAGGKWSRFKAPSRRRHAGLAAEPPALKNFVFFSKINLILDLF